MRLDAPCDEEIDSKVVGVGAMRPGEQRMLALKVDVLAVGDAESSDNNGKCRHDPVDIVRAARFLQASAPALPTLDAMSVAVRCNAI
ncbi:MAG: hypothetical protein ABIO49_08605 [Dokdonella sp.]